jgi:hypothetical protein
VRLLQKSSPTAWSLMAESYQENEGAEVVRFWNSRILLFVSSVLRLNSSQTISQRISATLVCPDQEVRGLTAMLEAASQPPKPLLPLFLCVSKVLAVATSRCASVVSFWFCRLIPALHLENLPRVLHQHRMQLLLGHSLFLQRRYHIIMNVQVIPLRQDYGNRPLR